MKSVARKIGFILITGEVLFLTTPLFAQETFDPPTQREEIMAQKAATGLIALDGQLNEGVWNTAEAISGFTQREPVQNEPASFDTEVRIVYDERFLYIGAVCYDSLSKKNQLRIPNMQRDFNGYGNDRFSVAIDGLQDLRNAVGFEVTPYGSQREIQVIDGAEFEGNINWDALWYVRTNRTDTAWVVEMAIPWKTLRYREGSDEMFISFNRNIRRNNEITTWPSYPRAFSHFRMAYAARLKGIAPPPPAANVQINPYVLVAGGSTKEGEEPTENEDAFEIGGEFKWALTPNTVIDGTINTDFAQADVDQQVQNLTRFSVLFPERRQFFLENANIFRTSSSSLIQPFFSRRIGLNDNGQPIPIDGGLRFTSQTSGQTSGMLLMRQRETESSPLTHFGVGRYVKNLSTQSRIGGMVTYRHAEAFEGEAQQNNVTRTINSFFRPNQTLSLETMVSVSDDTDAGQGLAGHFWLWQQKNQMYLGLIGQYVSENYLPGAGFLGLEDYMLLSPGIDLDLRPKWLPSFIRSYGPDGSADVFWSASDGRFDQAIVNFSPLDLEWQTGGEFEVRFNQEWQSLESTFEPLGLEIGPGNYQFTNVRFSLGSDFSKKLAGWVRHTTGSYYDGRLTTWQGDFRVSPSPYVELLGTYRYNEFSSVGELEENLNTHLLSTTARLALNPRVRLEGSFQYNSSNEAQIWNIRFSWEYLPLSFIYLVFNDNLSQGFVPEDRFETQELIGKITLIHQF